LSKDQLEQIGEAYQQNKRLSLVSQVAIQLLIYQGISTHELRLLKVHHLDLSKGVITIPADQLASRELPLVACQMLPLVQLIQGKEKGTSLLNYKGDNHLQNRHTHWKAQIKRELKKQMKSIPFENLQQLRNSRLSLWVREHGLLKTQYLAGHNSIVSTQEYQQPDYEALRNSFKEAHPFYKK
jgi:site-specific recombinase XerC